MVTNNIQLHEYYIYLILLVRVICARDIKLGANCGFTKVRFKKSSQLKMLFFAIFDIFIIPILTIPLSKVSYNTYHVFKTNFPRSSEAQIFHKI